MTTTAEHPAAPERDFCPQLRIINDLSYQVAGHQRRLALRSDNVADVKDVVETTNIQVITLASELAAVGERVGRLETAQSETNVRLGRLETAQSETNVRLGRLETAQSETNVRLDRLETAQSETNVRLDRLETAQSETNVRLDRLETAQRKTNDRLDRLDARLDQMDARMNRLEAGQIENRDLLHQVLSAVEGGKGRKKN